MTTCTPVASREGGKMILSSFSRLSFRAFSWPKGTIIPFTPYFGFFFRRNLSASLLLFQLRALQRPCIVLNSRNFPSAWAPLRVQIFYNISIMAEVPTSKIVTYFEIKEKTHGIVWRSWPSHVLPTLPPAMISVVCLPGFRQMLHLSSFSFFFSDGVNNTDTL